MNQWANRLVRSVSQKGNNSKQQQEQNNNNKQQRLTCTKHKRTNEQANKQAEGQMD